MVLGLLPEQPGEAALSGPNWDNKFAGAGRTWRNGTGGVAIVGAPGGGSEADSVFAASRKGAGGTTRAVEAAGVSRVERFAGSFKGLCACGKDSMGSDGNGGGAAFHGDGGELREGVGGVF